MDERKELEKNRDKLVHTRRIEIRTYDVGDHRVLVEGELADQRTAPIPGGDQKGGPVLIHHFIARIWVQGPDLTISAVEAQMPRIPRQMCPEVLPGMQKLVGLRIITGFTQKVKDLIGDVQGCSHLTNLFLTLGPAAVQGYWAAYGRSLGARSLDSPAISRVIDSCHVWRRDGPYVRSLTATMEKEKEGA